MVTLETGDCEETPAPSKVACIDFLPHAWPDEIERGRPGEWPWIGKWYGDM
jgi:hypothetical protein